MRPTALGEEEVAHRRATSAPAWEVVDGTLRRSFTLASFADALRFTLAVGALAEAADHHPDIDIRYRKVNLALVTHDAGGLTQLDFELAAAVDALEEFKTE